MVSTTTELSAGSSATARRSSPTATPASRRLGFVTLLGIGWLVVFGLVFSPSDVVQADSVRIMYIHVPSAWLAYLAFGVTGLCSAAYLWKRTRSITWDRFAGASAEVGVLFMAITLVTGSLWGSITWGKYWVWDARLTTTAFLFVTYVGYLAVRRLGGSHEARARRSAVLALLAVLEIPLVHFSVVLWRPLHQQASVANPQADVKLDGLMLFSLFVGIIAFTLLYAWLVIHRQRVHAMEDAVEARGLDLALAERRLEGVPQGGHDGLAQGGVGS